MRARGISTRIAAAFALASVAAAAACEPAASEGDECLALRIYHGVETPSALGLGLGQRAAIVAVYPSERATICSGVIVAAGVALTAGHCVDPEAPERLRIGYWDPALPEASARAAARHPTLDVGVLFFDAAALGEGVLPIPLLDGRIDGAWIGDRVEIAGFGGTHLGEIGGLRFASEAITAVDAAHLVVDGDGRSGACGGDSGGPLLARDDRGRIRVVGLLDSGHVSCVRDDHYTRVDLLADWWPFEWRDPEAVDRGCEGLDSEGACVRGQAMRCGAEGSIVVERCGAEELCGQRPDEPGFTCVAAADDACDGAGSEPLCDGDLLIRCEGGGQVVEDCGACGGTCAAWTPGGLAGCVATEESEVGGP
ncbi:MAG: trypsin-like serine protease [Myxococcales bacterium]|nr:trypsin-like serine protease [Myxococcales bacterium]